MPVGLTPVLILAAVASPVPPPPEIPHETSVIEGVLLGIQDGTAIVRCDGEVLQLKVDPSVRARLSDMVGQKVRLKVVDGVIVDVTPLATPTEPRQPSGRTSGRTVTRSETEHPRGGATTVVKEHPAGYSTSRSTTAHVSRRVAAGGGTPNTGAGGYGRGSTATSVTTARKSSVGVASGTEGEVSRTTVGGTRTASPSSEKTGKKSHEHPSESARVMERERPEPVVSGWGSVAALIVAVTLIATIGLYLYRRGLPARTHLYQTHSAT
ncbi:hypothetical protein [Methanopyrus kandleri]|uniref:Uncharacterized protein n=1 Tax=Methanopyrus kandleri TaxID=2320 RepID=A0A832WB70_9EURY|nr:hypothetical protein [Methanopyrus kandleri]HII70863.1 hypothetical protein [Methanopyrus kandleri]